MRKGERGLRIVAPKGVETTDDTTPNAAITTESDQAEGNETRVRFRVVSVFDISQTEGAEDKETDTITDPAAVLRDNLTTQIKRLGYTVTTVYSATAVTINPKIKTVIIPPKASVIELGLTLAELSTGPKAHQLKNHPATVNA